MPGNPTPTRFPETGVSDRDVTSVLGNLPYLDPTRHHVFFDDFNTYAAADWVVTETAGGATQATLSGDGGHLALVNTAGDDDVNSLQQAFPSFTFTAGKALAGKIRFKVSDATQSDLLIGLFAVDTSPIASAPTDGFGFLKSDAAATILFEVGTSSVYGTTAALATLADDTFYTFGWYCTGRAYVKPSDGLSYYAFDVYGGTGHDPAFITRLEVLTTAMPGATVMAPTLCLQNGEAVAKTLTVDYILISKER